MSNRLLFVLGMLAALLGTSFPSSSQTLDPSFQPTVAYRDQLLPGTVRALCRLSDGRLLVAGDFLLFNNWPTHNVARLWPNGRVDTTFLAPEFAGGDVLALAADTQGRVVVGGTFGTVGGQVQPAVARLLSDGTLDPTFRLDMRSAFSGGSPTVRAMVAQPDGKVVLGGSFVAMGAGGLPMSHIVRLLPSGMLDAGFVPAIPFSGQVGALLLLPTGEILVAGNIFSNQLELVRRLLPNGSLDPRFTIVPANQVLAGIGLAMALTPTGFVLVGAYYSVGNVGRASVARFLANGTLDQTFTSPLPGGLGPATPVNAVAVEAGGEVFIGGDLGSGITLSFLRRLLPNGSIDYTYFGASGSGPDATVTALLIQPDGKLLVGGSFASLAGKPRNGLARLLPSGVLVTKTMAPAARLLAYPNPAHDQLQVLLQVARLPQQVRLLDELGRVVRTQIPLPSQAELQLPTTGLPTGLYQLRVDYAQGGPEIRHIAVE